MEILKKIKLAFHLFDIFCVLPIKKYTQIYLFFHKIIIAHYCFISYQLRDTPYAGVAGLLLYLNGKFIMGKLKSSLLS
jgi:hypothetical protein